MIEISMVLWWIFFVLSITIGIIMIRKALVREYTRSQREYFFSFGIFLFIHLIARVFYYYFDFIYIGDEFFWTWGAIIAIIGLIFLLYAMERNIFPQSKFIFTIIAFITVILLLVLPPNLGSIFQTIILPILALTVPFFYFYVAYKRPGEIRKSSLIMGCGIFIFLAGNVAHTKLFFELAHWNPIYYIISPLFMIIGGIMFLYELVRST